MFSEKYLSMIKAFEGFKPKPYVCPSGRCTIGYGTNLEAHRNYIPYDEIRNGKARGRALTDALLAQGMEWDEQKAESALIDQLSETHEKLLKKCKAYQVLREKSDTPRAEALLDMAYNMGIASLMSFNETLPLIENGKYDQAIDHLKHTRWHKETGKRSRAICEVFRTDNYVAV